MKDFRGIVHMLITFAFGLFLVRTFNMNVNLWLILFAMLGSIFADIDHPGSLIGRYFLIGVIVFNGHRGMTHSILFALIFSAPIMLYNFNYGFVFLIGYLLHLIADSTTKTKLPLLYPADQKIGLGWFKTGGPEESLIALVCIAYILL